MSRPNWLRLSTIVLVSMVFCVAVLHSQERRDESAERRTAAPPRPAAKTYEIPIVDDDFDAVLQRDRAAKPEVLRKQEQLLNGRYNLANDASPVKMAGGRKAVQQGVRVKLHGNLTWERLGAMSAEEIKRADAFPMGFRPLPHVKHAAGGMVFPKRQIDEIANQEKRDLQRFDVDFDLPDHMTPEFPPPMFLTTRPDLGDVTEGKVLTIKNFYSIMQGKLTPVQMEGLRLLLTPLPQQQFNQTGDRKTVDVHLGVSCLDCHVNGHTNATFHLNPDTRPQENRFRIETVSLRGMFNQQIHGSKRSLRSIEDFTEFEQRTAYFDGDHATAAKKGVFLPNRSDQVALMAQMQNMFDFPPAPKLDRLGKLIKAKASDDELRGEEIFFGKGKCSSCHTPPFFLDHLMHDLKLHEFYQPERIAGQFNVAEGPIKTFTLRGIKDSPPYMHDGRLMTLEDTVEFFNVVFQLKLTAAEKRSLTAYMRCL